MIRGRPPVKSKPQTESGRERSLSGNDTGRSGHVRNVSGSTIDGDFSNTKLQPESPGARKDQLQVKCSFVLLPDFKFFFSFEKHSKAFILQTSDIKGSLEESST